jgi:SIR2-like domain
MNILFDINGNTAHELIFFLGAGASIPAGIMGVRDMTNEFLNQLQKEDHKEHLELTQDILDTLSKWKNNNNDKDQVDVELLLETIEKLENRHSDVMNLFYENKGNILTKFENLEKIPNYNVRLSTILKQSIKRVTGKLDIEIRYLNGLLKIMTAYKPLDIFSTNYDACIERFCTSNNKKYFDGFEGEWKPEGFKTVDKDVRLYKLHGSITWSRSETGKYTRNEIAIKNTGDPQFDLVTGEREVPIILYPGRKLEYVEPVFDLLVEFKDHLGTVKYIFVIGYEFRDGHIRKLFLYAARKNRDFILFLITPSAHQVYHSKLNRYDDIDFPHGFDHEGFDPIGFDTDIPSDLVGRVICLPYKFEKIVYSLKENYLDNLKKGQQCENKRQTENENAINRWHECLSSYIECEYIDKVEKIVEEKVGGWDQLVMNLNYKLGCEIIVKSLLNNLFWENGRRKWLERLKNYIPILEKLELVIDNDYVYVTFRLPGQLQLYGDVALKFYESLLVIYQTHPVFFNENTSHVKEDGQEIIRKTCKYLEIWRNTAIRLDNYIEMRKAKYADILESAENLLQTYKNDKSSDDARNELKRVFSEIEKQELQAAIL